MGNSHSSDSVSTGEQVLEPEIPICDAHHHLLDTHAHYLLNELLQDITSGHNIRQTVSIECGCKYKTDGPEELRPVGETEFLQGMTTDVKNAVGNKIEVAAGIVGFADLKLGYDVGRVLEAHIAASPHRFRGIRVSSTWDNNKEFFSHAKAPHLLTETNFRQGFSKLGEYNLSYDSWLYFHQLSDLTDLANAFPDTTIISDHMGGLLRTGPYATRQDEVLQLWEKGISELAKCPNVVIKLGGMGMTQVGFRWQETGKNLDYKTLADEIAPYMLYCIDKFGTRRCMFESNFPVDKTSYSYRTLWNAFKHLTKSMSKQERMDLFHDTAIRVYRLKV